MGINTLFFFLGEGKSLVQLEQQDPNQEDVFQSLPDINSPEQYANNALLHYVNRMDIVFIL